MTRRHSMPQKIDQAPHLTATNGGRGALTDEQRRAISILAGLVRELSPDAITNLIEVVEEFRRDGYLERVTPFELPAVKILAEVINGWEPDGIYEFARAWASTLVARHDGFQWDRCTDHERTDHRRRILEELAKRGY